jgi:hypothetical protein
MTDPRVDAYIARAQPFARPILRRLRAVVHAACPTVQETMKWSFPHFDYKGLFCSMAAFKAHCSFGFWKETLLIERGLLTKADGAMGSFGRVTSSDGLPSNAALRKIIRAAAQLNDAGVTVARPRRAPKPPVRPPAYVHAALARHPAARAAFAAASPSHRREYVTWVTDAKSAETRARRLAKMIAQLAAGKALNWQYERPSRPVPPARGRR